MDTEEPVKTINGETIREATYPITLHISASLICSCCVCGRMRL